jgi:hypothetical protein
MVARFDDLHELFLALDNYLQEYENGSCVSQYYTSLHPDGYDIVVIKSANVYDPTAEEDFEVSKGGIFTYPNTT